MTFNLPRLDPSRFPNLRRLAESITHYDYQAANIGRFDENGVLESDPAIGLEKPYIWVYFVGNRVSVPVVNTKVTNTVVNLAVITAINSKTRQREIIDVDNNRAYESLPADLVQSAASPDKLPTMVEVALTSFFPGRVEPTSPESLSVYVRGFQYAHTPYGNTTLDLTAVEAGLAANTKVLVVVGFNTGLLALSYTAGTPVALPYPLNSNNALNEAALISTDDSSFIRLGLAVIHEGQTAITWSDMENVDPRELFRVIDNGSPGGTGDQITIEEQLSTGTDAGTFTGGSWVTRALNTVVNNVGGHASLSSNQITLAAGTYCLDASAPAFAVNENQIRFYNITDSSEIATGTSEYANLTNSGGSRSVITGVEFTIAGSKVLELQHQCRSTSLFANGLGVGNSFGSVMVYAVVSLLKIS